jgi:hypothetical protein
MKYTYETYEGLANIIIRKDENGEISSIPVDTGNSDYAAYLEQLVPAKTTRAKTEVEPDVIEPEAPEAE